MSFSLWVCIIVCVSACFVVELGHSSMIVTSASVFRGLVGALKKANKTCTIVEQCCGGLIQSSIMAQPGASSVFLGGSVVYNTRKAKPLLLNDDKLYESLTKIPSARSAKDYIQSKLEWTARTSVAFCETMQTDYAIAEGGAAGPTFRPEDLKLGFAVVAVAGRNEDGKVSLLEQQVVQSHTANREENMRLFANAAARLGTKAIYKDQSTQDTKIEVEPEQACALMLDRATHLRSDTTTLEADANYIVLQGKKILVQAGTRDTKLAILTENDISSLGGEHRKTFLGLLPDGDAVFGVDLLDDIDSRLKIPPSTAFVDTRTTAPLFEPMENELALHATAYAQWQRRTSFCSLCGGATVFVESGTCCRCTQCNAHSWPRQDPSIICVISSRDGERVLLAHSPRHPPKLHTVLAGFVEAGETFEAAVAREAYEETGIRIDEGSVRYIGSQPWPFPQSCMVGFSAVAADQQPLNIDKDELVAAEWFSRDDVHKAASLEGAMMQENVARAAIDKDPDLKLLIPPKGVIARKLIDKWLAGET